MDNSKRVLMAMSGGIDSTVAAILLQEQGYELIGATYRTYEKKIELKQDVDLNSESNVESDMESDLNSEDPSLTLDTDLPSSQAINKSLGAVADAKAMCKILGIKHLTLDIRTDFFDTVICNFIDEYLQGRTPNPCVLCNRAIKWGKLQELADQNNCQYIATGHYAQVKESEGRYYLEKGTDRAKDQTYFLWKLGQENLARTIFPLGHLTKPEVRQLARDHGLVALAKKAESQEICFISDDNYRNFLKQEVKDFDQTYGPGNYLNMKGEVIGQHVGFPHYTIGQRKGLGIALGEPMYVTKINAKTNEVTLGRREDLLSQSCILHEINTMRLPSFEDGMKVETKIRYRSKLHPATLWHETEENSGKDQKNSNTSIRVTFEYPIESITPGQSLVAYQDDELILGGIIQ